jgi:hypothetical protein
LDRILLEAEETAKRRRKSHEILPQKHLAHSTPPLSRTLAAPQASYHPTPQTRLPHPGQESTPVDDQRNSEFRTMTANSVEPCFEEVDRIFLEAVESSKRKRQSLQMNPPSTPTPREPPKMSTSTIPNTIPLKPISNPSTPQFHSPCQPQANESEPSIEEVDRMLMEAEETFRRKRQSQGNGHLLQSRSSTAPAPSSISRENNYFPTQQMKSPHPGQGSTPNSLLAQRNSSQSNPQFIRNGVLKQASDPDLNTSSRFIRPIPAYSTPTSRSSTAAAPQPPLTATKENERPPVPSNPYSKFEASKTETSTPKPQSTPKLEISYDTISFEDFAAIEEMEQFALSQRNSSQVCLSHTAFEES